MPIYEYECETCGQRFDKLFRSINKIPEEIECPACQGVDVQRLMSAPAIRRAGEASADAVQEVDSTPAKPPVFGRKELNAAMEKKRQLRDMVDSTKSKS